MSDGYAWGVFARYRKGGEVYLKDCRIYATRKDAEQFIDMLPRNGTCEAFLVLYGDQNVLHVKRDFGRLLRTVRPVPSQPAA